MIPNHTSSFLRAGSKFKGTQQSDRQNYNVEVDIKHVDMAESELCGYLRIEGTAQSNVILSARALIDSDFWQDSPPITQP